VAEAPPTATSNRPEATVEVAGKGALNLALADPSSGKQHTVQRGENLTVIARQFSVPDSALDKFITALYQENPDAFMQQNLHYLKAGAVLALPSEESLSLIDEKAARKTIATQWQTFKSLLPAKDTAAGEDTGNRSSTRKLKAGGTPAAGTSGDHLTLAALKPSDTGGKTEEEAIAARKAAEEANERIRLLEKNILEMKSSIQPEKPTEPEGKPADTAESAWGILASPARDLMMQGATVLLLAALVVVSLLRRQPK
jgi:pilus assembly protein FimV